MSEVNHAIYARATTPAIDPSVHDLTVEEEAQARARRIREIPSLGERQYNVSRLQSDIQQCRRNIEAGYPDAAPRLALLTRTLELVGRY